MRTHSNNKIWITVLVMLGLATGCGDPDKNGLASPSTAAPTVILASPPPGSVGVCSNIPIVNATFSKAMNPATINTATFFLATPGGSLVPGNVSYSTGTNIANFTPLSPLASSTTYTATITTGAADTFGNTLAANFVWSFTTGAGPCPSPVISFPTPGNGTAGICPNTAIISATFSKPMNPATITNSTFTVAGPGLTTVPGAVTYIPATQVAMFTPTSPLALNTTYTATVTTGAADTLGNPLAATFGWSFTTALVACVPPPPPPPGVSPLGTACNFGILGGTPVVSSVGPSVVAGGDVGISPGASITGFPLATLTGVKHPGDAVAATAKGDLSTAYGNAAGAAGGAVLTADIGGQTLAPGVYKTTSAQPSLGITGILHLNGPANGIWIFQIVSTLTTAAGNSQVIMGGGALPKNVFWQVGSSATLGTNTTFAGNIMAQASITLTTGATLNGRALAMAGAVSMDSNPVNVPTCP